MPKRKRYSPIGIDLQPHSAKMVQLHFGPKGTSVVGYTSVTFEESLLQIEDQTPECIVNALKGAVRSAGFSGRRAVITLPPNKVDVRTLTLAGSDDDLGKMLRWEAESYLHFDVADATLDYVKLGEVNVGNEKRWEVLVAAVGKPYVHGLLELFAKAGVFVKVADIVPMALSRLGSHVARELDVPVSMIDIGRTTSVAVILNKGDLRLARTIPRGGEEFTSRIMSSLDVDHGEAELLKKEYGTGVPTHGVQFGSDQELVTKTEVAGTIHEILRHELEEIGDELQKLFRYFATQRKGMPVGRGYLCGGSGRMNGLDTFLSERIGVQIDTLPALSDLFQNAPRDDEFGPEYAVAVGLALRSVDTVKN